MSTKLTPYNLTGSPTMPFRTAFYFSPFFTAFAIVISVVFFYRRRIYSKHRPPLPPGPPGDLLIHHLRVIPTKDHAETYHEWSKIYGVSGDSSQLLTTHERHLNHVAGDVIFLSALGRSFVVLATEQAAIDLMEKRSAKHSNRPALPMHELYVLWFIKALQISLFAALAGLIPSSS